MPEPLLKPPARHCAVTAEAFAPGDSVVSYLLPGPDAYVRVDVGAVAARDFVPPGIPLCRWVWEQKEARNEEREAARAALEQHSELFMALCETDTDAMVSAAASSPATAAERAALRQLLGLMLQRKRLLRPMPGAGHRFIHVPSGREVQVPPVPITPELAQRVAGMI
jgi:hypothetical protein